LKEKEIEIGYRSLGLSACATDVLFMLKHGFSIFDADYFLTGEKADVAWQYILYNSNPFIAKNYLEFAVKCASREQVFELVSFFERSRCFSRYRNNPFTLLWERDQFIVSIVPNVNTHGDEDTSGFKEIFLTKLPKVKLGEIHELKLCSLEGLIFNKICSWDWDEIQFRYLEDMADIIQLICILFENESSISPTIFKPYKKQIKSLFKEQQQNQRELSFSWCIDGAAIIGQRIEHKLLLNEKIKVHYYSNISRCLEDRVLNLFDQINFERMTGTTEYMTIDRSDVKLVFEYLKHEHLK